MSETSEVITKVDPPRIYRDASGKLKDSKTNQYVKDSNKPPKVKYNRNMSERKKALLRDTKNPNSDLSLEAREYILKHNPPGYEVSHEKPLYTRTTPEGKQKLDKASNMKTQPETKHRKRHQVCGDQYHKFGPANKPHDPKP